MQMNVPPIYICSTRSVSPEILELPRYYDTSKAKCKSMRHFSHWKPAVMSQDSLSILSRGHCSPGLALANSVSLLGREQTTVNAYIPLSGDPAADDAE